MAKARRRWGGWVPVLFGMALLLAGCGGTPAPSPSPGHPSPKPSASPAPTQLTVIAPLGVNLRSGPSTADPVVGVLAQGVTLPILSHTAADGGWWQVQGSSQSGWVTAQTQYTSTASYQTYAASSGVAWSVMYLDSWTFDQLSTAEVKFVDSAGSAVTFYTAASVAALPAPAPAGAVQRSVTSVEVYGVTAALVTYQSSSAYQASVELQSQPALAFLITAQLPLATGSTILAQFLETVFVS